MTGVQTCALPIWKILGFGVADDDVILRDEEGVRHFALGGEGFTGTGRTQDQPDGVLEPLAVNHDHVVGQRVQPVVESLSLIHISDDRSTTTRCNCRPPYSRPFGTLRPEPLRWTGKSHDTRRYSSGISQDFSWSW